MAFKTVNNLLSDLNRKISPGNVSNSRDIFGSIAEGTRQFLEEIRPKELSRRVLIENALYDQVRQFSCPEDLDEKKIMQWYKLGSHSQVAMRGTDTWNYPMHQVTNREFDSRYDRCNAQEFTIEWQTGVKFIKVTDFKYQGGIVMQTMDSLTDNGSWNTFGNTVNLQEDHLNYISGNGSLRFDINNSTNTGGIYNYTMNPIDISDYFTVGKIFTWIDLPNANQLQTVQLDLLTNSGNINTDYYSITVNSPHDTTVFQVGWNLMGFPFDLNSMNQVGSPDPKNVIGLRFTFNMNSTLVMNNVRMDNIVMRKGAAFGIQYLSNYVFNDATTGLWQENPIQVSDEIHLAPATYNLLLAYCAVILGQEVFSDTAMNKKGIIFGKIGQLMNERETIKKIYQKNNKTEFIDEQQFVPMSTAKFGYPFNNGRRNDSHTNTAPTPTS